MRRHWWRFLITALIIGAGLPGVMASPAAAAPEAPELMTFVCPPGSSPAVCGAVTTVETTLRALELISPGLAPAWLVTIMDDLTVTSPLPDYEAKFDAILAEVCGGGSTAPGCLEWEGRDGAIAQRIKEAAKQANLLELACTSGTFSWSWVCPDPDGTASPEAQEFWAYPGGEVYGGPFMVNDWRGTSPLPAGGANILHIPVPPENICSCDSYDLAPARFIAEYNASSYAEVLVEFFRASTAGGPWEWFRVKAHAVHEGWAHTDTDWVNGTLTTGAVGFLVALRTATNWYAPDIYLGDTWDPGPAPNEFPRFQYFGTTTETVTTSPPLGWLVQSYDSISAAQVEAKFDLFTQTFPVEVPLTYEAPPRPGTEELPTPTTEAAPSTTTIPPPPTELEPAPHPDTGTLDEKRNGLLENLVSGVASGFNWLGNMLGGLLRSIVDMIRWLGDIFGYWIRWLWERLGQLLRSIRDAINSLGDLMEWMLQQVIDGVLALGEGLWSITQAVWNLPDLIWQKFLNGLQLLFVPSALPTGPVCTETFPCNWVAEANATIGELKAGIDGAGGCVAPSIGWSGGFSASFPPPPGCSGGNGIAADAAPGDLFGWRTAIRSVLALALWVGFIRTLLQMAPWSRPGDMPLGQGVSV